MSKRILWIDNLSGLLIIQMIFLCHIRILAASMSDSNTLRDFQYFLVFFMPWFFYKSGMFFRENRISGEILKDCRKLLKPFIVYSLFGYIFQVSCMILRHETLSAQTLLCDQFVGLVTSASLPWQQPLWFLVSLFMVKNIFNVVQKCTNKYIILAISLFVGYICSFLSPILNFWMGTTCQALFFFSLGFVMKDRQFLCPVFFGAFIIYVLRYVFDWVHVWDARINTVATEDNYILTILVLVAGVILFNNVFRKFMDVKFPLLTSIGENSMLFYVVHFPCVMFLRLYVMPYLHLEGTMKGFAICSVLMIAYLWVFYVLVRKVNMCLRLFPKEK